MLFTGKTLWILQPNGQASPIARFAITTGHSFLQGPVVLKNGDVWFAINQEHSTRSYRHAGGQRDVYTFFGDRSRWVRARIRHGKLSLGEISASKLRRAIHRWSGGRDVIQTQTFTLDPRSGGILAYDGHYKVIYIIRPRS